MTRSCPILSYSETQSLAVWNDFDFEHEDVTDWCVIAAIHWSDWGIYQPTREVILDFAVASQTDECVSSTTGDAKSGHGLTGYGAGGDVCGQIIRAIGKRLINENLFPRVGPVTVTVEVDPSVQDGRTGDRGADRNRGVCTSL